MRKTNAHAFFHTHRLSFRPTCGYSFQTIFVMLPKARAGEQFPFPIHIYHATDGHRCYHHHSTWSNICSATYTREEWHSRVMKDIPTTQK